MIYEQYYGQLPPGYEVHHIIPKRLGGTDDLTNLIALTRADHSKAHFELYEKYGDHKDLCAAYWLSGNHKEGRIVAALNGGKIGGKRAKELGVGIHRPFDEQSFLWCSIGGKKAQNTLKEKQISAFYDPKLRKEISSKGGKNGGFTMSHIQSSNGKRGGVKNKGFTWITDGIKNIKYTLSMKQETDIEEFLTKNPTFKLGRSTFKKEQINENC